MLVDLLNQWVKALDLETLEKARNKILSRLRSDDRTYLRTYYQPKEPQFCRAYTRVLPNLGANSTQRNESYHVVVKQKLNKNLSVSAACEAIVTKTKLLAEEYNERINDNRKNNPTLMDLKAFAKARSKLTHYAIDKTMAEWRATKDFADAIDSGDEDPFEFEEVIGCPCECELPLRFGLPCKHWMLPFYLCGEPLSLFLFHPRWLLDGPAVVQSWRMSSSSNGVTVIAVEADSQGASKASKTSSLLSSPNLSPTFQPDKLGISKKIPGRTSVVPEDQGNNDHSNPKASRYFNHGAQLIIDDAAKVIETLQSLPAGQKEVFASGFHDLTIRLQARTSEFLAHRKTMPTKLPNPFPQPNILFKKKHSRGYIRAKAAEENKKDACYI